MFYIEDKIEYYPGKSGLLELLGRKGAPGKWDVMPFIGCQDIKDAQISPASKEVTDAMILSSSYEFNVYKARANEENAETRDYGAREVKDFYTRLEDVPQSYIEKYVREQLIGFKKHKNGKQQTAAEFYSEPVWTDKETGALVSKSDIRTKERHATTEESILAKEKLPYLLKQLHQGSIEMKGSLLSFIIAMERVKYNHKDSNITVEVKPSELTSEGVYHVNQKGDITSEFTIKQNNADPLRRLIAWVRNDKRVEDFDNNIYYKAYMELLNVTYILEIDLRFEDARNYDSNYIKKAVCTYIASNSEYLESYGYADPQIVKRLGKDQLFSIASTMTNTEIPKPIIQDDNLRADKINMFVKTMSMLSNSKLWKRNVEKVDALLKRYKDVAKDVTISVKNCEIAEGILRIKGSSYLMLDTKHFMFTLGTPHVCLTASGLVVLIEEVDDYIHYLTCEEAIENLERRGQNDWHTFDLSY